MVIALPVFLERMSGLLPAEKKQASLNTLPQQEPFEILFHLNCDNLLADFHEDLDFRFSWERWGLPKDTNLKTIFLVSMLYLIVCVTCNGLI